jgi:hypothetical protein
MKSEDTTNPPAQLDRVGGECKMIRAENETSGQIALKRGFAGF